MHHIQIRVPQGVELLVQKGQKVEYQTPLYEKKQTEDIKIPLARILNIKSDKIFRVLKKFVGERVEKGEMVAFYSGMFRRKRYVSEHDGVITEVNHTEGYVVVESETEESANRSAWFSGEISDIKEEPNGTRSLEIKVKDSESVPIRETGHNFGGEFVLLDEQTMQTVTEEDVAGKVIVAPILQGYEITKLEVLGAVGFIFSQAPKEAPDFPFSVLEKSEDISRFETDTFSACATSKETATLYLYRPL